MSEAEKNIKSLGEIKRENLQKELLYLLYSEQVVTASLLSKSLNLSLPTIRGMLDSLIEAGIVEFKDKANNKGGRTPLKYQLNKDAFWTVAIEVNHFSSFIVIVNCHNHEITDREEVVANIDDAQLVEKLYGYYQKLINNLNIDDNRVIGIGISLPGLVDASEGINYTIKDSAQQKVALLFSKKFQLPVVVENDARMMALGELLFGKAAGYKNALVINWSWGIGLGIINEGDVYAGSVGFAGEFSHIRMIDGGQMCECGKTGCLQTIASLRFLIQKAKEAVWEDGVSLLTREFKNHPDKIKPSDIVDAANRGDEVALLLLRKVSENLAWGLSILIQLYNPELILIKGPLASADQHITIPLTLALNRYCLNEIVKNVELRLSVDSDHLGLLGVAAQVFKREFNSL